MPRSIPLKLIYLRRRINRVIKQIGRLRVRGPETEVAKSGPGTFVIGASKDPKITKEKAHANSKRLYKRRLLKGEE